MPKAKILLLDDDANLNDTIMDFKQMRGYIVDRAYDGMRHKINYFDQDIDLISWVRW